MPGAYRSPRRGLAVIEAFRRGTWLLLMFLAAIGAAQALAAGDAGDPDWPCVQRKVASISAATVWDGPEIPKDDARWRGEADIAELVREISSRRMPLEQAYAAIDGFAATLGTDRNEKLTLLFSGILQTIDAERSALIQGIERYTRRQKQLADKVKSERGELQALRASNASARRKMRGSRSWRKPSSGIPASSRSGESRFPTYANRPFFWSSGSSALARHVASLLE